MFSCAEGTAGVLVGPSTMLRPSAPSACLTLRVVRVLIVNVDVCVWMQSPLVQKSDIQVICKSFKFIHLFDAVLMYAKYENSTKLEPTY